MDGIIDIIIAVLFIAIPAIFKAIGNRLEKSGSDKAWKYRKIAEKIEDFNKPEEESDETEVDVPAGDQSWGDIWKEVREDVRDQWTLKPDPVEPTPEVVREPAVSEEVVRQANITKRPEHIKPTNKKPMMLIEDEPEKKGEKIDPKKLVIYSEIMKKKF